MIDIKIPEFDLTVQRSDFDKVPNKSGIYIFYDKQMNPLYVGQATDLKTRVSQHFTGRSNTGKYAGNFHTCTIFYEDIEYLKEIYEIYLINTLNTPLNAVKNFSYEPRIRSSIERMPAERCQSTRANGKKCRNYAMHNGLCRHHGGK